MLVFDFIGHGQSQGKQEELTYSKALKNLISAVDFLKKQGIKKINLIGHSFGAGVALLYSSRYKVNKLALLAPIFPLETFPLIDLSKEDFKKWKQKGIYEYKHLIYRYKIGFNYYKDLKRYDLLKIAEKMKIPTLLIWGTEDEYIIKGKPSQLAKKFKNKKIIKLNCSHDFYGKTKEVSKNLINFFKNN